MIIMDNVAGFPCRQVESSADCAVPDGRHCVGSVENLRRQKDGSEARSGRIRGRLRSGMERNNLRRKVHARHLQRDTIRGREANLHHSV